MSSAMYSILASTAREFVHSTDQVAETTRHAHQINESRIRAVRGDRCMHRYGHNHMVSKSETLQTLSTDKFINHMGGMATRLQSWETEIEKVWVDVVARAVILQVVYHMVPQGMEVGVDNQVIWTLTMDEQGGKVVEATEFLDAVAVEDLVKMIKDAKSQTH